MKTFIPQSFVDLFPFYMYVDIFKIKGGKKPSWSAQISSQFLKTQIFIADFPAAMEAQGVSSTADGAIKDLQKKLKAIAQTPISTDAAHREIAKIAIQAAANQEKCLDRTMN